MSAEVFEGGDSEFDLGEVVWIDVLKYVGKHDEDRDGLHSFLVKYIHGTSDIDDPASVLNYKIERATSSWGRVLDSIVEPLEGGVSNLAFHRSVATLWMDEEKRRTDLLKRQFPEDEHRFNPLTDGNINPLTSLVKILVDEAKDEYEDWIEGLGTPPPTNLQQYVIEQLTDEYRQYIEGDVELINNCLANRRYVAGNMPDTKGKVVSDRLKNIARSAGKYALGALAGAVGVTGLIIVKKFTKK